MAIELNHMIVPAGDKDESARFFERLFGFRHQDPMGPFAPVQISSQALALVFDRWEPVQPHHYGFKVSEAEFDEIFGRIVDAGLVYGSEPQNLENMEINHRNGGRGVYVRDPRGHLLERLRWD